MKKSSGRKLKEGGENEKNRRRKIEKGAGEIENVE